MRAFRISVMIRLLRCLARAGAQRKLVSTLLAVLLFSTSSCMKREETGLGPERYAPTIELETLEGEEVDFKKYRGKLLLLNFWTSWCAPCVAEMPALQNLQSKFSRNEFEILAIAVDDDVEAVEGFRERLGLTLTMLHNPGGTASRAYKVNGFPESFFVDPEGKLKLVPDPHNGEPVLRIVGPRDWESANATALVRNLLSLQKGKQG